MQPIAGKAGSYDGCVFAGKAGSYDGCVFAGKAGFYDGCVLAGDRGKASWVRREQRVAPPSA